MPFDGGLELFEHGGRRIAKTVVTLAQATADRTALGRSFQADPLKTRAFKQKPAIAARNLRDKFPLRNPVRRFW